MLVVLKLRITIVSFQGRNFLLPFNTSPEPKQSKTTHSSNKAPLSIKTSMFTIEMQTLTPQIIQSTRTAHSGRLECFFYNF